MIPKFTFLTQMSVAVDNSISPKAISLNIKHSKTDQFSKGVKVVIGQTDYELCPVTTLLTYLSHRGTSPGPLFRWHNNTPLSKTKFVSHVRLALLRATLQQINTLATVFALGQPQSQLHLEKKTPPFKH